MFLRGEGYEVDEAKMVLSLLTLIGDMTVSFSALELHMQVIFILLVDQTARVGHILASQLSLWRRRRFSKVKSLMARAAAIEEERNRLTHSFWGAGDIDGTIKMLKITAQEKRGLHFDTRLYDDKILR